MMPLDDSVHSEDEQDGADAVVVSLQEQLEREETTLRALLERHGQVAQQLVSGEQEWLRLQAQTLVLRDRKLTLQEARTKHSSLRTELHDSLQKSREKLSKLEKIEACVTENRIPSSSTSDGDKEFASEILLGDTPENNGAFVEESTETAATRQETENEHTAQAHQLLRVTVLDALALHDQHRKSPQDKIGHTSCGFVPFLSMVDSKLVSKIMRHYQMESMILADQEIEKEGTNLTMVDSSKQDHQDTFGSERAVQESTLRRGLLRNTCLDFLILQSQQAEDACDPHDTGSVAADVVSGTDDAITTPSHLPFSASTLAVMDPNIPLCPYELAGVCADEYCPYQHTDPNRKHILPRELLPLPPLKLSLVQEDDDNNNLENNDSKPNGPVAGKLPSEMPPKPEEDATLEPVEEGEVKEKRTDETSDEEEEFMILPRMETEDEDEDEDMDIDESSSEEEEDATGTEANAFWWSNQELPKLSHDLPVEDVLLTLGGIQISVGSETAKPQIEVPLPKDGSSIREWVGWLGRLLDCCRLATSAGRHDLALAILPDESLSLPEPGSDDATSHSEKPTRLSVARALGEHELIPCVQVLHRIRQLAYSCGTMQCSVFQQEFVVQVSFAILSEYLKAHWDVENPTVSDEVGEQGDTFRSVGMLLEAIDLLLGSGTIPEASGDGLQEDLKGLFTPNNPAYENLKGIVGLCTALRSRSISITRVEDSLLKPAWSVVIAQLNNPSLESTSIHSLACIALMGFVLLSCFERVAANVDPSKDVLSPRLLAALTSLDKFVHQILKTLGKRVFGHDHLLNLTLPPLVAASVASACFLRQYSNAHNRLTMNMFRTQLSPPRWLQYSDLLWSQLVHLRMSLPVDSSDSDENATRTVVEAKGKLWLSTTKDGLVDFMETVGVRLNHISLIGDSNFTALECRTDKEVGKLSTASESIRRLILDPGKARTGFKSIDLGGIEFGGSIDAGSADESRKMTSSLPRLILLPSQCSGLSLRKCKLESLPPSFGLDLTNVIRLDVSYNSLHRLPVSIAAMTHLEELHLNHNMLTDVPELPGSSLRVLNVSHNRLSTFPAFLLGEIENGKSTTGRDGVPKRKKMRLRVNYTKAPSSYQQLEVLVLAHNCFDQVQPFHSKLILNLKKLRRLEIEPQGTTGDY